MKETKKGWTSERENVALENSLDEITTSSNIGVLKLCEREEKAHRAERECVCVEEVDWHYLGGERLYKHLDEVASTWPQAASPNTMIIA